MGSAGSKKTCFQVVAECAPKGKEFSGRGSAVITGGTSGLGVVSAESLALAGFDKVFITARKVQDGEKVKKDIIKKRGEEVGNRISVVQLDLSDLATVADAAQHIETEAGEAGVACILCNAGCMMTPFQPTKQQLEWQFGVNHVAHTLFCELLLPSVRKAAAQLDTPARIVAVSSMMHTSATVANDTGLQKDLWIYDSAKEDQYNRSTAYGQSKLANILMCRALDKRFQDNNENIIAVSLHPGVIKTNLFREIPGNFFMNLARPALKSIPQGAATSVYCCLDPAVESNHGNYHSDCAPAGTSTKGKSVENAQWLMDETHQLINQQMEQDLVPVVETGTKKTKKTTKSSPSEDPDKPKKKKSTKKNAE